MEKLYITSLQNPQVKAWRALKDVKARAEQGLFLAEGDHLTGEALTAHAAAALLIAEQEQALSAPSGRGSGAEPACLCVV